MSKSVVEGGGKRPLATGHAIFTCAFILLSSGNVGASLVSQLK